MLLVMEAAQFALRRKKKCPVSLGKIREHGCENIRPSSQRPGQILAS